MQTTPITVLWHSALIKIVRVLFSDSLGRLNRKPAAEKDEGDTGLGTASVDGDSDDAHIVGKVGIYASDSSEGAYGIFFKLKKCNTRLFPL